ncbi:ADP-ribosylation factor GTPase-activating protein 2-like, partial [Tropilaelaps mercedesae]
LGEQPSGGVPRQDSLDFFEQHTSEPTQRLEEASQDCLFSNSNNNFQTSDQQQKNNNNNVIIDSNSGNIGSDHRESRAGGDGSGNFVESGKPQGTTGAKKIGGLGAKRIGGLGARKAGGLGAQKASVNFDELEREAKQREEIRQQMEAQQKLSIVQKKEQQEKQLANMRLAYQDISAAQKKKEQQMRSMDPKKAEQVERLGMGFGGGQGISHSALSDMKVISQDEPRGSNRDGSHWGGGRSTKSGIVIDHATAEEVEDDDDDEYTVIAFRRLTYGGPPKYSDSPFSHNAKNNPSSNNNNENTGSRDLSKTGLDWMVEPKDPSWGKSDFQWLEEYIENPETKKNTISSTTVDFSFSSSVAKSSFESAPSRSMAKSSTVGAFSGNASSGGAPEAVKKFANAKSISSDQFFGGDQANDYETRANLSRFEGSNAISSSDYFGNGQSGSTGSSAGAISAHAPNLYEIKEGLRDGATKVATRLSSIASGVMSSLQDF